MGARDRLGLRGRAPNSRLASHCWRSAPGARLDCLAQLFLADLRQRRVDGAVALGIAQQFKLSFERGLVSSQALCDVLGERRAGIGGEIAQGVCPVEKKSPRRSMRCAQVSVQRRRRPAAFAVSAAIGRPKLSGKPNVRPARNSLIGRPSTMA